MHVSELFLYQIHVLSIVCTATGIKQCHGLINQCNILKVSMSQLHFYAGKQKEQLIMVYYFLVKASHLHIYDLVEDEC